MRVHSSVCRDDSRTDPAEAQWVVDVYDADDPTREDPLETLCWYHTEHEAHAALLAWCRRNGADLID